tara:strand:+ start:70 stop:402 length:333 start_codon:yes stop_codon:yes gene_type:complete
MKYIILLLVLVVFVSGCTDLEGFIQKGNTVSTGTITFINEIDAANSGYSNCEEKLMRKHFKEDGTYEEICTEPREIGLKRCKTDANCSDIEECKKGFCELVYSLVIDETT